MNIYLLPAFEKYTVEKKTGSFTRLLQIPTVMVTCVIVVVVAATWGFLDPTLEPHLRQFNLSPGKIGLIFLLLSAMYGIFSPGWGWLSDRLDNYWWIMSVGLFCNAISLMFMGPSPIFNFLESTVWLNIISLSTLGISVAMAQMPTYRGILDGALKGGFTENLGTHSVIAGLWSCVYSLGEVIGPIVGGALMDTYGFPVTSTVFAFANIIVAILVSIYFILSKSSAVESDVSENKSIIIVDTYKSVNEGVILKETSSELFKPLNK